MKLRPYQEQAVEAACEQLATARRTLIVMPTGLGKTLVAAEIIRRMLVHGRVKLIAHREELLEQARAELAGWLGEMPDLEKAENYAADGFLAARVVVASVQTEVSGRNGQRRMHRFRPEEFGLLVIDEAHRSVADTYREVVNHYCGPAALLGVTATPDRHDEQALGQVYRTVAFDYELTDAIAEGWLVPIRQKFLSVELDLSGTRYTLGDFHGADLRALLAAEDTLERIASDAVQWAGERRTLVFADCVANAERLTVALNRHRLGCAALVTGELPDPERRRVIADYRAGATQYLVNVGIATEGFNVPEISCILMARPTASRSLYTQMAGRGTRALAGVLDDLDTAAARCAAIAASNKTDLLLLDVVGNSARHKLITAADILGGQYDTAVVERAERTLRDGKVPTDVAAALETAQREHNAALRAKAEARERLTLRQKSKARDVDPFDVLGIAPHAPRGWQSQCLASDEQREKLKRWGFDRVEQQTEASAAQLIDAFRARCRRGLATYKQSKVLIARWGMKPETARETSFEEASRLITILANNGWRRPAKIAGG